MLFQGLALLFLAIFYAVYLGKMLLQKKKGIQTDQMARGNKRRDVICTEIVLKIATFAIIPAQIICIAMNISALPGGIRIAGILLCAFGDTLFALAVVDMRDSWRAGIPESDQTALVTGGLYQFSRNPAFLGFDLMYLGILLMFYHWSLLALTVFAMAILHRQILKEEAYLKATFGQRYLDYRKMSPRYLGPRSFRRIFSKNA